ncbi:MAG: methionine synthase [Thermoprotei archaeon]|nr:MAG: methionine synthase [Thermoprotei archaeon]RLF00432.1 MAG: methionine synthase [Thermoprotei archaeon]
MILTTYVGSFPLSYSKDNILRILRDVEKIPIDYPCYPQLKDFIFQFLQPISLKNPSLVTKDNEYILKSKSLRVLDEPIAVDDLLLTLNYFKNKKTIKGIRACVTGPFTLASRIVVSGKENAVGLRKTALTEPDVINALAETMSNICKYFAEAGAVWVNIDEPILSVIVGRRKILYGLSQEFIIETLNATISRCNASIRGIHVCGVLSPLLRDTLLMTDFKVLDHEFKDTPANIEIFDKQTLEKYDKKISFGCISSKNTRVENIEETVALIKKAANIIGIENIGFIKPDCGFRGLKSICGEEEAYRISIKKLKLLKTAQEIMNREYGFSV